MAEHSTAPVTEVRVDVQEPTSWSRRLSITVPSERVRRVRQSVAAKIAGNVRLPGFRKGKTPASLVERQFGPAIEQETVDRVIQETYKEALDQGNHQPISQGEIQNVHYHGDGGELHYDVQFEVHPKIELAHTSGFVVARPADQVGDAEVDAVLERIAGTPISKLAELLPRAETQGFSRNIVNRVWANYFGVGLDGLLCSYNIYIAMAFFGFFEHLRPTSTTAQAIAFASFHLYQIGI